MKRLTERGVLLCAKTSGCQIVSACGETVGQLRDAVSIGGRAGCDAFEFYGGLVGLRSSLANLLVERVAVVDALGVLGVHLFDGSSLCVDLRRQRGDLFRGGSLLGIELRHAAGQHNAETRAQFIAQRAVALGLGGLTL